MYPFCIWTLRVCNKAAVWPVFFEVVGPLRYRLLVQVGTTLQKASMEPEMGPLIDYRPLRRVPFVPGSS